MDSWAFFFSKKINKQNYQQQQQHLYVRSINILKYIPFKKRFVDAPNDTLVACNDDILVYTDDLPVGLNNFSTFLPIEIFLAKLKEQQLFIY